MSLGILGRWRSRALGILRRAGYAVFMPRYDYRCRACGDTFEVQRPMSEANANAACPAGHDDTVKLLSTVAVGGGSAAGNAGGAQPRPSGGGCCGGSCGC